MTSGMGVRVPPNAGRRPCLDVENLTSFGVVAIQL